MSSDARAAPAAVLVVPGYAVEGRPRRSTPKPRRARLAARVFRREGSQVLLLSGGNVHPTGTGFNEAVELRRFLLEARALPPWRIAVDPYARHTTTNLRNAGRFLLAHEVPQARVVTSRDQSFYLGAARISSFHARCRATLGYEVGRFAPRTHRITDYRRPSRCASAATAPRPLVLHVRRSGINALAAPGCVVRRSQWPALLPPRLARDDDCCRPVPTSALAFSVAP
ncbi:MAG: ElyC/SanA/YdcF family protein [Planctomycetota bacterium]